MHCYFISHFMHLHLQRPLSRVPLQMLLPFVFQLTHVGLISQCKIPHWWVLARGLIGVPRDRTQEPHQWLGVHREDKIRT